FHRADRAQDFATIGEALASGDLATAQQAVTSLAGTFSHGSDTSVGALLLGPPTPIPSQVPPGPPTPIPPQSALPPAVIPPTGRVPPGPPTFQSPPSTIGSGPSGPPQIIGGSTESTARRGSAAAGNQSATANYQLELNSLETASNTAAQNNSLSLRA